MWAGFEGYYRPTEQQFEELWAKAMIVPDTNVLLNQYRYPEDARNAVFAVLDRLSERLWLPHQVALEFQSHRLGVIASQQKQFMDTEQVVKKSLVQLKDKLEEITQNAKHLSTDTRPFLLRLEGINDEFSKKLKSIQAGLADVHSDDPIREHIESLFVGKIGAQFTQAQYDCVVKDGKSRYVHKRPPGFMDAEKAEPSDRHNQYLFATDADIDTAYGDLIIWKQILKVAEERQVTHLIFVTDDRKPDWWWIEESQGKKTIGPRPELLHEMMTVAPIQGFYIYTPDTFLKYAKSFLGLDIRDTAIQQVFDVAHQDEIESALSNSQSYGIRWYERVVLDWLSREDPSLRLIHSSLMPDRRAHRSRYYPHIIGRNSTGEITGYVVEPIGSFARLTELLTRTDRYFSAETIDRLEIVSIMFRGTRPPEVVERLRNVESLLPDRVSLTVGALTENSGERIFDRYSFVPVYRYFSL